MAAATADRVNYGKTDYGRVWPYQRNPASNSLRLYEGTLICLDATGYPVHASDTAGLSAAIGVLDAPYDAVNAVTTGELVRVRESGRAEFITSGASAIVQADVGQLCYVLDNQTVVKAAGTTNSIVAGTVKGLRTVNGVTYVTVKVGQE